MATETDNKAIATAGAKAAFDIEKIKADFPILNQEVNGHRLVYLDNAATSQTPKQVIDALSNYYLTINSNIHRGLHTLAERATDAYERTRAHVAKFIGGVDSDEVILTSGTTESLNTVMYSWGYQNVGDGDEIVISEMEHHANMVPWYVLARRKNAVLKRIPITPDGQLDMSKVDEVITDKTKIVAVNHMSNVLGTINPIAELAKKAHAVGAIIVADGAQSAPHMAIDMKALGVDFYAFSSHKMLGPTGVGVLWGKREILDSIAPLSFGGEMIREVSYDRVTWADLPHKFEAGTPNIADVVAFDAALTYLENIGMDVVRQHEKDITAYALKRLGEIEGIEIQGPRDVELRGGAVSFTDPEIHPHDISTYLDSKGIAVRAGHHCAQPLMRTMGKVATARASFYIYNDKDDVDALYKAIVDMRSYFNK